MCANCACDCVSLGGRGGGGAMLGEGGVMLGKRGRGGGGGGCNV